MKILMILALVVTLQLGPISKAETLEPEFVGSQKMGLELKREWSEAMETGVLWLTLPCSVRVEKKLRDSDIKGLSEAGLKIDTALNTIVTGRIAVGNIPYLVSIESVKSVELSKSVGLKRKTMLK